METDLKARNDLDAAARKHGYVLDFEQALTSGALVRRVVAPPTDQSSFSWDRVLAELQFRVREPQFRAWIEPLELLALNPEELVLKAPNEFSAQWIFDHYLGIIREAARTLNPLSESFRVTIHACSDTRDI